MKLALLEAAQQTGELKVVSVIRNGKVRKRTIATRRGGLLGYLRSLAMDHRPAFLVLLREILRAEAKQLKKEERRRRRLAGSFG